MHTFTDRHGRVHPLSPQGHAVFLKAFGNAPLPCLEGARFRLKMLLDHEKVGQDPYKHFRDQIAGFDSIININRALDNFEQEERDWRVYFKFCDQIHTNKHTDLCGCVTHYCFDHYSRADKPRLMTYAHHPCAEHSYEQDLLRRRG